MLFHLAKIREDARGNFNQATNGGFISDDDIDTWANEGYIKYCLRLMLTDQGFFEKTKQLAIVAGQEEIDIPSAFTDAIKHQKTTLLERVLPNDRIPLRFRRRYDQANVYTGSGAAGTAYLPTYKFRGNKIILEPTPDFSEAASASSGLLLTCQVMPARLRCKNAVSATPTTIVLDNGADPRDYYYAGERIFIVSGTGAGQIRNITAYVGATQTATVDVSWGTNPDQTSVYAILPNQDFPEPFHELLSLYPSKCAFMKERSRGIVNTFDAERLKELEKDFQDYTQERTTARKYTQPWHIETM